MKKVLFLFVPSAINLRHVLLNDFCKQGMQVAVALPEEYIKNWKDICPNVRFIPFEGFSGTSIGLWNNLKTFLLIRDLLKKEKPEAVFFGNVKPNVYGGIVAYRLGIKHLYGLISGLGYAFIDDVGVKRSIVKKICMWLYKLSFKHFTHVFFQNKDDREFFIENGLIKSEISFVVNGTGVDLQRFSPQPYPEQITFFMAARLIKEKGVLHYVEAAKALKQQYPAVRFVLAGNIDKNPSAITEDQLKECSNFVEYQGYCENMAQSMNACSVFVYPSYYREGVPRALLEALACGRPVITTDCIGCREAVIDQKNGFKIVSRDTEALKKAMEQFILNPMLMQKMGHESRTLAENRFDIHKVNEAMYTVVNVG